MSCRPFEETQPPLNATHRGIKLPKGSPEDLIHFLNLNVVLLENTHSALVFRERAVITVTSIEPVPVRNENKRLSQSTPSSPRDPLE